MKIQPHKERSRPSWLCRLKNEEEVILMEAVTVDPFEASNFGKKSNSQEKKFILYD